MRKNQKSNSKRRSRNSFSNKNRDPSFTHVLTFLQSTAVTGPANAIVTVPRYDQLNGFEQLASFFEMVHPVRYRIRYSYTGWSGTACFVPENPYSVSTPTLTSTEPQSILEVRGSVRIQQGYTNNGVWCRFPFAVQGWQSLALGGSPGSGLTIGYMLTFNDAPGTVASWTIQSTLEVECRFFRRTLYQFTVTPTLSSKLIFPKEPRPDDDDSDGTLSIASTK